MLSGRGLCDELTTRPEESYRLCCVIVCDLETSRIGAPYIYDISNLRVKVSVGTELRVLRFLSIELLIILLQYTCSTVTLRALVSKLDGTQQILLH